jgi:hypothetical protein
MIFAPLAVIDHDHPQAFWRVSKGPQGHIFGDHVILAIASAIEELRRHGPEIGPSPIPLIASVAVVVHVAIDAVKLLGLGILPNLGQEVLPGLQTTGSALSGFALRGGFFDVCAMAQEDELEAAGQELALQFELGCELLESGELDCIGLCQLAGGQGQA